VSFRGSLGNIFENLYFNKLESLEEMDKFLNTSSTKVQPKGYT
jgi:hypothetical protein